MHLENLFTAFRGTKAASPLIIQTESEGALICNCPRTSWTWCGTAMSTVYRFNLLNLPDPPCFAGLMWAVHEEAGRMHHKPKSRGVQAGHVRNLVTVVPPETHIIPGHSKAVGDDPWLEAAGW